MDGFKRIDLDNVGAELEDFRDYAKSMGINISVEKSDDPDTFEKIFGFTTESEVENADSD